MNWIKMECEKRGITDPNERLVPIKAESVSKALYRACEKAGLHQYAEHKTGVHAIRKAEAQRFYEKRIEYYLQEKGEDWKKAEKHAKEDTSVMLGHGSHRSIDHYITRFGSQEEFEAEGH